MTDADTEILAIVQQLKDERDRLLDENAALREIAQAVVRCDVDDYDRCCLSTDGCDPRWVDGCWQHADDCPVTKARKLLNLDA